MKINTSDLFKKSSQLMSGKKGSLDNFLNKEINFSLFNSKNLFKSNFFTETSILVGAGMDLKGSLEIIISVNPRKRDKDITEKLLDSIIKGSTFSNALQSSNVFTIYDIHSIRIGEESGTLSVILKELAQFYSKRNSLQKQIRGALAYPIMVLYNTTLN